MTIILRSPDRFLPVLPPFLVEALLIIFMTAASHMLSRYTVLG